MSTRDLQSILLSGELTGVNLNGTADGDRLMTKQEISDALSPVGIMLWRGPWVSDGTYGENQVVTDGAWLMIANKDTQQRPAPVPVGSPIDSFPAALNFLEQAFTGCVYSGQKFTLPQGAWLT